MAGQYLAKGLASLKEQFSCIRESRGMGLIQGLELSIDGKPLVQECLERRVLINCTMDRVLRFVPPLVIGTSHIDRLLSVLHSLFSKRQ